MGNLLLMTAENEPDSQDLLSEQDLSLDKIG
jgi:hypothetical protein